MLCLDNYQMNIWKLYEGLFNRDMEREGKLPHNGKSALILPFSKLGKAPDNAGNYRHVALTSHLANGWKR